MKKTAALIILILGLAGLPHPVYAQGDLPDSAFIDDLVAYGQTYPLSCESRSASDLAAYWGISAPEIQFFNRLPVSDNPEKGFVGSVFGAWGGTPPNAYGVHAKPVAALLREYGLDAAARRGMTIEDLKNEIANGRPVIVWVVGHVWQGTSKEYQAKDGSTVIVAPYEHTMIAYGYDPGGIYLADAGNASRRQYAYRVFESSWAVLGNMAVTADGGREVEVDHQYFTSGDTYTVQKGDYLSELARQWGMDWKELADINNIGWPYTIYPGQVLVTNWDANLQAPAETSQPTKTPKETIVPEPTPTPGEDPPVAAKADQEGGIIPPPENYTVQKGEHLMQIARNLNLNWQAIAEMNHLLPPYQLYPGLVLTLPGPGSALDESESGQPFTGETYVVQKGEYLYRIGKKIGINWRLLADFNGIHSPYIVYPNQVLRIP
ncbi:MAG: LysM peptidoglycan-binding domain-containing protein [Anaerolineales bacterium]|nr:LysM peptidoglycan-binding domain-containing protein [Anaerolineales bacterium]